MHAYGTEETLRKRVNIKVGMQVKVTRDVTRAIERCCETRLDSGLTFDSGSSEQPFHATLFPPTLYTQSSCTAKPRFISSISSLISIPSPIPPSSSPIAVRLKKTRKPVASFDYESVDCAAKEAKQVGFPESKWYRVG